MKEMKVMDTIVVATGGDVNDGRVQFTLPPSVIKS